DARPLFPAALLRDRASSPAASGVRRLCRRAQCARDPHPEAAGCAGAIGIAGARPAASFPDRRGHSRSPVLRIPVREIGHGPAASEPTRRSGFRLLPMPGCDSRIRGGGSLITVAFRVAIATLWVFASATRKLGWRVGPLCLLCMLVIGQPSLAQ